ncbi:hypothetical protein [Pseudomonas lopnurensis]|uniref:hypothetical protein n=1 Tax=Pseudomonas lopnurensis TaxID=1477517 RepID=UPI0028A74252|nr:hypothetical protein [Pseudomonas lopnurensis]
MKAAITLYDALVSANVPADKAKDVVEAWEKEMNDLVTQSYLKAELKELELKLTLRMGMMLSAAVGIMIASMRFML